MRTRAAIRRGERARPERQGVVLVLFALFLVGFLGLAAATIDLGVARASRLTMQNAADAAALEGLRWRDALPDDPQAADALRRVRAAEFARRLTRVDASLPLVTPDAGQPLVATLGIDASVWQPRLELNLENQVHGDLVAGTWLPSTLSSADPAYAAALLHFEGSDYLRSDFDVSAVGAAARAPTFLARLRRSAGPLDQSPGVSSSGAPLPFLFGHHPGLQPEPGASYDPFRDGITLRATAVADTAAAIVVGSESGLEPLVLGSAAAGEALVLGFDAASWNCWSAAGAGVVLELSYDAQTGIASCSTTGIACPGSGELCAAFAAAVVPALRTTSAGVALVVGDTLPGSAVPAALVAPAAGRRYLLPVLGLVGGVRTIVGVVAVELEAVVFDVAGTAHRLALTRVPGWVAPTGASALVQPFLARLTADPALYAAFRAVADPVQVAVFAR